MTILPIAYFPSVHYLKEYFSEESTHLEIHENFVKQSIRNRCEILSGNGVLRLSIPLNHSNGIKIKTKDIRIDFGKSWQTNHWKAIKSAYASAPYFEDYEQQINQILLSKDEFLLDKNQRIFEFLFSILEINKTIDLCYNLIKDSYYLKEDKTFVSVPKDKIDNTKEELLELWTANKDKVKKKFKNNNN
jgi:hypothetical protein